jgi:hypothetical protein
MLKEFSLCFPFRVSVNNEYHAANLCAIPNVEIINKNSACINNLVELMYLQKLNTRGNTMTLTPASAALLVKIIQEAEYENGNEMMDALMDFNKEERGNLTDLKKKGYVSTTFDPDTPNYIWCALKEASRPLYEALH